MQSPRNLKLRRGRPIPETRGTSPKPESKGGAESILEVTDVVHRGTARRSRIDLTVVFSGRSVRLTGLPARHVLRYHRIAEAAIEQGSVLPYFRYADQTWRKFLAPAMEKARVEPWLEGEEIAEAIAEEIRGLVESSPRGESASDLSDGKVLVHKDRWMVSPERLVHSVRGRLRDDVLPRADIEEAAAMHLGMRQMRPTLADGRPRAWTFPLSLPPARQIRGAEPVEESEALRETCDSTHPGAMEEAARIRSMDHDGGPRAPLSTERSEQDPVDHENVRIFVDPVPGPQALPKISFTCREMPAGSSGPRKTKSHMGSGPWTALLGGISSLENKMWVGSNWTTEKSFPGPGLSTRERSHD